MQDLDQEAAVLTLAERPVTADISSLLQDKARFAAAFEEEANFCAGSSQIHTHSPTCLKYAVGRRCAGLRGCVASKPPGGWWKRLVLLRTACLHIRRSHSLVNRWNKAIAVGLRHNHDISFVATMCKTMALIYYVTNYTTKVEDPVSQARSGCSRSP